MPEKHLPVRPDLTQLKHQAKDLLRRIRAGDPEALQALAAHHPEKPDLLTVKLADAQLALARSYGVVSWPRLTLACDLIDALWRGEVEKVRGLIRKNPELLTQNARGTESCNWGPPLSYAGNVGDDAMVRMLVGLGATDVQHAFERACLRGKIPTARLLHALGGRPVAGAVMGPCETLSAKGLALQLELGATLTDAHGDRLAPLALALETYSRDPEGKHGCLEIFAENGYDLPDTPVFAVHRGRVNLLKACLGRDPDALDRQFSMDEIYPLSLGCHEDRTLALHGTPLAGGTLLHLCVDFDEYELARWLLERGADVDAPAAIDADGFGGHTALFGCVVSQPYRCGRTGDAMTRLLLGHGADPGVRANLRKELRFVDDAALHEYRNATAREWGERFHDRDWVNPDAMALLRPA